MTIPAKLGRRIVDALSAPMVIDELTLRIGASVGFAVYPDDATDEQDLIRKADMALYRVKSKGRSQVQAYDASLDVEVEARARLEEQLAQGIRRGEVVPYFQPFIELATGRPRGFEVLGRWQHASKGLVFPADFIPIAEEAGQLTELTLAILKQACITVADLPSDLTIAINIAPQQLDDELLAVRILAALSETGFAPHRLEVELTEQALVTDIARAKRVISLLRPHGIKLALDDFGTGYSSLSYLSELPFDTLKIDRSFIKSLHDRPESLKVVTAIIGLSRSLGLTTIAEGVETERDAQLLSELGCDLVQGFLYSRAVPKTDLPALLRRFSLAVPQRQRAAGDI
jgi:predicted signal transduction protein with EAL and GGDEF domain